MNRRVGVLLLAMLLGLAASARASAMVYHLAIKNDTDIAQRISFQEMQCMHIASHSGGYDIGPHQVWNGTMVTVMSGTNSDGQSCSSNAVASSFWLVLDRGAGGTVQAAKRTMEPWRIVNSKRGRFHIVGAPGLVLHLTIVQ
ncbi:MAG: hypothetical protein ACP5O6_10470 [Candidatus Baltobacteraceae bacterium]